MEVFVCLWLEGRRFMRVFFSLVEFWVEKSCDDVSVAKVVNLGSAQQIIKLCEWIYVLLYWNDLRDKVDGAL